MKNPGELFWIALLTISCFLGFGFYVFAHAVPEPYDVILLIVSFCLMMPPFFICLITMVFAAGMS